MNDFAPEIRYVTPEEKLGVTEPYFTARFLLPNAGFHKPVEFYVSFTLADDKGPEASLEYLEKTAVAVLREQLQSLIEQIDASERSRDQLMQPPRA